MYKLQSESISLHMLILVVYFLLLCPTHAMYGVNETVQLTYRPYAIPHVTKRETDSGRKSGYYAAILSGKEVRGIGA